MASNLSLVVVEKSVLGRQIEQGVGAYHRVGPQKGVGPHVGVGPQHMGLFIPLDTIRAWLHHSGPVEAYQRIFGDDAFAARPAPVCEAIPALPAESGAILELPASDLLDDEFQCPIEDR